MLYILLYTLPFVLILYGLVRLRRSKCVAKAKRVVGTTLPHSEFGAPDCCGRLNGITRWNEADIVCNECGEVIRTVPAKDLRVRTEGICGRIGGDLERHVVR